MVRPHGSGTMNLQVSRSFSTGSFTCWFGSQYPTVGTDSPT